MTSRPNSTRQTNTNTQQNQNQIRTRSQLALPELNVEYDRSPLKHARDAMRRANARFLQEARAGTMNGNGSGSGKGEVDAKMADVLARAGIGPGLETQRYSEERENEIRDDLERDEGAVRAKSTESTVHERPSVPRGPFDFSGCSSDTHPKYPKRPRSSSFDETALPSPSGFGSKAGGNSTPESPLAPPRRGSIDISSTVYPMAKSGTSLLASSESTPTASGASNSKRAKLTSQGTLDTFFKRSSGSSSSSPSINASRAKSSDVPSSPGRRFFSEASSEFSHRSGTASTPLQGTKPTRLEEPVLFPKTPTIKQLRAIPTLDLRTVTPSPRKPTINLGLGAPSAKPALKTRAVSVGAALVLGKSRGTGEGRDASNNNDDDEKRATSEPHESVETEQHLPNKSLQPSLVPLPPSPPEPEEAKKPSIDVDSGIRPSDTLIKEKPVAAPESPRAAPSITVSTSTTTDILLPSAMSVTTKHRSCPPPEPREEDRNKVPLPTTPRHKILPSRPLPSGHLPSTKSHLSELLSLSPLTPLSAMESKEQGSEEYDYKEEQRTFEEEERKQAKVKDEVKLTYHSEEESKSSDLPTPVSLSTGSVPKKPGPSSSSIRKQGSKDKHKGKMLSSTSRGATGAAGIKKRKSLVSVSGTTPRMRLTRASVLRQKAIQVQMRTPKGDKGRPSPVDTKSTVLVEGGDSGDTKQDDKTVRASTDKTVQDGAERKEIKRDKHAEPQPQRSPRKTFVLTVPSSLSPRKSGSAASSANSSLTLKSIPKLDSGPSKQFTFSLYPPPINDPAANEQAKQALNKLSSALDKLAMPPPSKPNTSAGASALRRPASEQRERIRPTTSLGFTREMSVPVSGPGSRTIGRPRSTSRAGSVDSTPGAKKSFLPPPPPPAFGSSLSKDKAKAKALANSSRTAPVAFRSRSSTPDASGNNKMPPPSSFRFGFGGTTGVFGRPIPRIRASQNPSLETVQGSPVKGGLQSYALAEEDEEITEEQREKANDGDVSATSSNANGDTSMSSADGNEIITGKELKRISKLNASRRASMAFTALSQSLMTSPDTLNSKHGNGRTTPVDDRSSAEPSTDDNRGALTSSTSRPQRAAAPRSFASGYPSLGRTQSETSVRGHSRSPSITSSVFSESDSESTVRSGSKSGRSMGRTKMPGSLDVLAQCTVFVDVRTDEGDDAGALFVDMLRGLGAKVLTRVGQTCTHIVYKNGLASTLTKYRLLDEPRPHVVGIGWVVECAEKRARVDETRFKVDIENINIAGTLKRRRSFLPKQVNSSLATGPMDAFLNGPGTESTATSTNSVPKACADSDPPSEDGDTSQERTERATLHSSLSSSIHPLERARRRSVMIPR